MLFRDQLSKNWKGLPIHSTPINLFKIKKTKIQALANNHDTEKFPVIQNYKLHTYFKNCIECNKYKIRKQLLLQCKLCGKPLCPGRFLKKNTIMINKIQISV